jgi:hypothetical protein
MAKLPLYEITIDQQYADGEENLGIDMIAFTSNPAIRVKGVAFKSDIKPLYFTDKLKMRIVAPMLIPMQIYRKDKEDDYEYEVSFSADVIEELHVKMMANLRTQNLFNLEHDSDEKVPAFLLEAWIVEEPLKDKAYSTYNIEVPKGTLMAVAQLTDERYYKSLVDSDAVGFSIEGFLGMKEIKLNSNSMMLPDGEHLIEGKIYVLKDGEVIEIKDKEVAMEEEVAVEEEVAMEDAPVVEEEIVKEEEMAVDITTDAEAVLAIVQPKIDELIALIAEVKAMIPVEEEDVIEEEVVMHKMNAHDKLKSFMNFKHNK